MTTTLNEARSVLIKLTDQFPAPSTYSTQLAILSDYFDNQVPLLVQIRNLTSENQSLLQRIGILEAALDGVRKALPNDPAIVTLVIPSKAVEPVRRGVECTKWIGRGCTCRDCVAAHA